MFEIIDQAQDEGAVIKVIGVGGCGGNAVEHMIDRGLSGVEFICANTDAQALKRSTARTQLQLGLDAHARPRRGRQAGDRPRRGDGGPRPHRRDDHPHQHGLHHRRHGRRDRHGRSTGHRQNREPRWAYSPSASSPALHFLEGKGSSARRAGLSGSAARWTRSSSSRRLLLHDPHDTPMDGAFATPTICSRRRQVSRRSSTRPVSSASIPGRAHGDGRSRAWR